jgi:hypothetical protein
LEETLTVLQVVLLVMYDRALAALVAMVLQVALAELAATVAL